MSKQYSPREIEKILAENNYVFVRRKGSIKVYSNGKNNITLPCASLNYKVGNKIVSQCRKGQLL